ncbi:AMP-binding protein [Chachezhania sediminis]|uniref:AMP-binding protein n=1 Tax=Chachezhania sediminis TaxID=2599291 RepID=UPI0018EF1D8E|nr:AMP-binding protein [Chachezhania sediminis]
MINAEAMPEGAVIRDPRVPGRDTVVTRPTLERLAAEQGDKVFAKFDDNLEEWTYARFHDLVRQTALGLQQQGVGQGDMVLVFMPNNREQIRIMFALNYLGAVYVPINTAYRGGLLEHVVKLSDAKLAIVHAVLAPRLADVPTAALEHVIVQGGDPVAIGSLKVSRYDDVLLPEQGTIRAPGRAIEPWDPMAIVFTSGTTGPSKAVLISYVQLYSNAGPETWPFVDETDRYLINAPMFHLGGMGPMYVMFVRGASFAMIERFDTKTFWNSVHRCGATVAFLLGVMATFLEKQPPSDMDRGHGLKKAIVVPITAELESFRQRFGIDIYTIFNMTEASSPCVSEANPTRQGTCGKVRRGVEVRLVDDNDCEVPVGEVGEMLVRTDRPWAMNSGYYNNPEATAKAWRNGWFHTGDAFRRDEDGYFYFVDRTKDAIRRRGENISSMEVEGLILRHPAILEAAVIGVPSEFGEDDVMVILSAVEGQSLDRMEVFEFMREALPYFMVPRYIRFMDRLPRTPSEKVMKAELRKEGITADTWDREAHGIRLTGERIA